MGYEAGTTTGDHVGAAVCDDVVVCPHWVGDYVGAAMGDGVGGSVGDDLGVMVGCASTQILRGQHLEVSVA